MADLPDSKWGMLERPVLPTIRHVFRGPRDLCTRYIKVAEVILGQLRNSLALGGIELATRAVRLPDGTLIRVLRDPSSDILYIDTTETKPSTQDLDIGIVVLPADNDHINGFHSDGWTIFRLPIDNTTVSNERFLDAFLGRGVYLPGQGQVKPAHRLHKRFGNQYWYEGGTVYSWWFSPFGDGPISLNEVDQQVGDIINLSDKFPYRPVYQAGIGFTYIMGYDIGNNNAPRYSSVPLVIYRNNQVLPFIDMRVTDSIPGFNTNGSLIINGFGKCSYDGKTRYLISVLNIHTFQTWSAYPGSVDITDFGAQVILLCYEEGQLLETIYTTPADINVPPNENYFSICIWPWRFNSTGTECVSITLEYRSNDIGADNYFIRVVRVPITHARGNITVGTGTTEAYPIVISETVQDVFRWYGSPFGETVTWDYSAHSGTEYNYNITNVPIAVDYDDNDNVIYTKVTFTSLGGSSSLTTMSGTSTVKSVSERITEVNGSDTLSINTFSNSQASKSISIDGMIVYVQNEPNSSSYSTAQQDAEWDGRSNLDNPGDSYYNSILTVTESSYRNYYGFPVALIGYISTKRKVLLSIEQRIGSSERTSNNNILVESDGTETVSGKGSYRYVSGLSSEIRFKLYVNGILQTDVTDLVAPDAEEYSNPPTNAQYSNGWPGEHFVSWDNSVTITDKRGVFPLLNMFSTSYTPYTPPVTTNTASKCSGGLVVDFRVNNRIAWIVSINQQPGTDYEGIMEGRSVVKASFSNDPRGILGHTSSSSRFSTMGLY